MTSEKLTREQHLDVQPIAAGRDGQPVIRHRVVRINACTLGSGDSSVVQVIRINMRLRNNDRERALWRAAMMGIVAGLRSQIPFLTLARAARKNEFATGPETRLRWLKHPRAERLLSIAAVGEFVVDKLPIVPNRTDPGPLFGRMAVGAAAGVAIAIESQASLAKAAAAGAVGGLIGSFAGRFGRAFVVRTTGSPDFAVALAEDGLAFWFADRVLRSRGDAPAFTGGATSQPNAARA
jgi:uncharacterized membrane protein